MLSQSEAQSYEQQSNYRAGYCASCGAQLSDEVYCCEECAHEAYIETDPNGVMREEDDE